MSEGCVYSHRRTDPEFRDAFWIALEQGVAKLVALRLQRELERAQGDGDSCRQLSPNLDGPPDEKQIVDLIKLMQMLRDLCRNLSGGTKPGRPQVAEVDEVCAALAKRLKAFPPSPEASGEEVVVAAEGAPPPSCGRSPSPTNAGEE